MDKQAPTIEQNMWTPSQYEQIHMTALHETLQDLYCARYYGFSQYRLPTPGRNCRIRDAEEHITHVQTEWAKEMTHRNPDGFYSEPDFDSLPLQAKVAYHEIIEDQKEDAHNAIVPSGLP